MRHAAAGWRAGRRYSGVSVTTESRPEETSIRVLLRDPSYLSFWFVGGFTGVVRWFQLLALGVYTFETTNSPLLVSVIPLLWMLPLALCGPVVGAIADRLNRKMLLAGSIAAITVVTAGMAALAWAGELAFVHVAIASFLSGIFWATDMPVRRRLLGDLSGGALSAAMGLDAATSNATRMLGPLLGGVTLQFVGVFGVFLFSAIVYGVCFVLVVVARVPERALPTGAFTLVSDLIKGIRYVAGEAQLRRILAITIAFNVWGFPFTSMIPVLGRDHLGLDPFMVGVLSSLEGFGAFAGALLVATVARPANYFQVYLWGTVTYISMIFYISILTYVAGGPVHSFVIVSIALAVTGVAGACFSAMQSTLTYLGASPEYRSRVLGVLTLCIGSGPIGFFNVGWMADIWGAPTALFIMSLEGLLALTLLWLYTPTEKPE
jgi:MFS family permease